MDLRRAIQQDFRASGLFLSSDALRALLAFAESSGGGQGAVDSVVEAIEARRAELPSSTVSLELMSEVLEKMASTGSGLEELEPLQVISAFDVPRFQYNVHRKMYFPTRGDLSLHGEPGDKMQVHIGRMHLLQQRLRRNSLFSTPAFAGLVAGSKGADCEITELKNLHSSGGQSRFVMGCISQLEDGRYFLEDLSGALPIDLTGAVSTSGYFTENIIVIADGKLRSDGVFKVNALGFPPPEAREESITAIQGLNMFGGNALKGAGLEAALEAEQMREARLVMLSDIWLDKDETLHKLAVVFDGYNGLEQVPDVIVMMGNFNSQAGNGTSATGAVPLPSIRQLQEGFTALGQLIAKYERLHEQTRWVFVPGPGDPCPGVMLPRPPLPDFLVAGLKEVLPAAEFTSNPCRIRWYTQEIAVFRYDLQQRMRRQCLLDPLGGIGDAEQQFEHLMATVLQQSHLCPLPLNQQPVYWQYDHAMHLFPLPHLLVLADGGGQAHTSFSGCKCVTPGSFCRDSHFISYCPDEREIELSALPEASEGGNGMEWDA
eukprot:jgi/Tetstr1/461811/TSEL_006893.t1